jgi:hypothetical protein
MFKRIRIGIRLNYNCKIPKSAINIYLKFSAQFEKIDVLGRFIIIMMTK